MKLMLKISILICLLWFCNNIFSVNISASDKVLAINIEDEYLPIGKRSTFYIKETGFSDPVEPTIDLIEGLDISYKKMEKSKTRSGYEYTYMYHVVPYIQGRYKIGPITVFDGEDGIKSNIVSVEVGRKRRRKIGKSISQEDAVRIDDHMFLRVRLEKERSYNNQLNAVYVDFYTDWLDIEDVYIRYTKMENVISEKFESSGTTIEEIDGVKYALISFKSGFFIPFSGESEIGPIAADFVITKSKGDTINDNEKIITQILGEQERKEISIISRGIIVDVLKYPERSKPDYFNGAIGQFNVKFILPRSAKIEPGYKYSFSAEITGTGNYASIKPPELFETADFFVYDTRVTRTPEKYIANYKIKALESTMYDIPSLRFAFFNPDRDEYEVFSESLNMIVPKALLGSKEKLLKAKKADDITGIKTRLGRIYTRSHLSFYKRLWLLFLLPLLGTIMVFFRQKRKDYLDSHPLYAGYLEAKSNSVKDINHAKRLMMSGKNQRLYPEHIISTIQRYFGRRYLFDPKVATLDVIRPYIGNSVEGKNLVNEINDIFDDCYRAKYGQYLLTKEERKHVFIKTKHVVDCMNKVQVQ
jgi:hypothetical protein